MAKITVYEVWSRRLPFEGHEPVLHGRCAKWNVPGTEEGAVQLKDKVNEHFFRLSERVNKHNEEAARKDLPFEPVVNVHVSIKTVEVEVEL